MITHSFVSFFRTIYFILYYCTDVYTLLISALDTSLRWFRWVLCFWDGVHNLEISDFNTYASWDLYKCCLWQVRSYYQLNFIQLFLCEYKLCTLNDIKFILNIHVREIKYNIILISLKKYTFFRKRKIYIDVRSSVI